MANVNINNTNYSITDEWLNNIQNFFPNEDPTLLKASLFGYCNEIMANEIKNSVYHKNFIYDEHLLATASTAKSIYNFAKLYNINPDLATPAQISVNLSMKKSDIQSSSLLKPIGDKILSDSDSVSEFVIPKTTVFTINTFQFMLPYDVQLLFTYNNITRESTVTAKYIVDNNVFPFYNLTSSYIKTWENTVEGEKYIYLKLELFQLLMKSKAMLVTNQDISDTLTFKFSYEKQLAYFDVFVEEDGKKEKIQALFNDSSSLNNGEKYCNYNLLDDNSIEITFLSLFNSYRPAYNSRLILDIYYTDGKDANFGSFKTSQVNFGSATPISSIPMIISPLTDCYSGKDKPSLLELKKKIIEANLLRNVIVTDGDLNIFFNNIDNIETINESRIQFYKKRNDVLRRVYSAFLLLRDSNKMVIPTRTMDKLRISETQLKEINGIIPERSVVIYDINADNYFLATKEVEIRKYKNNENYILYSIPYTLCIENGDILMSNYYKTFINKDIKFNEQYINPLVPYKFIITSFNISRNSLNTEVYTITMGIATNLPLTTEIFNNLKIRGILKDKSGKPYGYFDFTKVAENDLLFEAKLATEKYNSIVNRKLNLYNSLFTIETKPNLDASGNTSLKNCYVDENLILDIQILYKNSSTNYRYEEAASMPDLISANEEQYASAAVFRNSDVLNLFTDMSDITESIVLRNNNLEDNGVYVKSIPLVEYNYMINNFDTVYNILEKYIIILKNNLEKLETNTELDMKFFNTHGPSKLLYYKEVYNTKKGSYDYYNVGRIDLKLSLDIYLNSLLTENVNIAIKEFISNFIEDCNKEGVFPRSTLGRKLEENFPIIKFIEFNDINGNDAIQKVADKSFNNDDYDKNDFVPEFMNMRKSLNLVTTEETIEKTYKYEVTINYK